MADTTTTPQGSKPQSFLSRNDKLISLIGAFIVFMTFVVKEGIRDHVSARVNALESAETAFLIRTGFNESVAALSTSTERIEALRTDWVYKKVPSRDHAEELWLLGHAQHAYMVDALNNAKGLFSKLKNKPVGLVSELDFFERTTAIPVYKESDEIVSLRARAAQEAWQPNHDENSDSSLEEIENGAAAYSIRAADGAREMLGFGAQVLSFSQREREEAAHELKIWTWVSYVLYCLGWGVGLLGKASEHGVL